MAERAVKIVEITVTSDRALRQLKGISDSTAKAERQLAALQRQARDFSRAMLASFGALGAVDILKTVSDVENLNNRLRAATGGASKAGEVWGELFKRTDKWGVDVKALGDQFSGLAATLKGTGTTFDQIIDAQELFARGLNASGASAQTAAGAIQQFNQAMGTGVAQGDEYRSIVEAAPVFIRAWAQAITGEANPALKEMAKQGQFTIESLIRLNDQINENITSMTGMAEAPQSIAASFVRLQNAFTRLILDSDGVSAASRTLSGALELVADHLDAIAAAATALAAVSLVRWLGTLAASVLSATGLIGKLATQFFAAATAAKAFAAASLAGGLSGTLATIGSSAGVAASGLATLAASLGPGLGFLAAAAAVGGLITVIYKLVNTQDDLIAKNEEMRRSVRGIQDEFESLDLSGLDVSALDRAYDKVRDNLVSLRKEQERLQTILSGGSIWDISTWLLTENDMRYARQQSAELEKIIDQGIGRLVQITNRRGEEIANAFRKSLLAGISSKQELQVKLSVEIEGKEKLEAQRTLLLTILSDMEELGKASIPAPKGLEDVESIARRVSNSLGEAKDQLVDYQSRMKAIQNLPYLTPESALEAQRLSRQIGETNKEIKDLESAKKRLQEILSVAAELKAQGLLPDDAFDKLAISFRDISDKARESGDRIKIIREEIANFVGSAVNAITPREIEAAAQKIDETFEKLSTKTREQSAIQEVLNRRLSEGNLSWETYVKLAREMGLETGKAADAMDRMSRSLRSQIDELKTGNDQLRQRIDYLKGGGTLEGASALGQVQSADLAYIKQLREAQANFLNAPQGEETTRAYLEQVKLIQEQRRLKGEELSISRELVQVEEQKREATKATNDQIKESLTGQQAIARLVQALDVPNNQVNRVSEDLAKALPLLVKYADQYGVARERVIAMAYAESRFSQAARSPAGAVGVMQLMAGTARDMGISFDQAKNSIEANIEAGVKYVAQLMRMQSVGDSTRNVAQAYNAGPGAFQKSGGNVLFEETQKYTKSVLEAEQAVRKLAGSQDVLATATRYASQESERNNQLEQLALQLAFERLSYDERLILNYGRINEAQRALNEIRARGLITEQEQREIMQDVALQLTGVADGIDRVTRTYLPAIDALAQYNQDLRDLDNALAAGAISLEQHAIAVERATIVYQKELPGMAGVIGTLKDQGWDLVTQAVDGFVDSIYDADRSFGDFARNFLRQIAQMISKLLIMKALESVLGVFGFGPSAGVFSAVGFGGTGLSGGDLAIGAAGLSGAAAVTALPVSTTTSFSSGQATRTTFRPSVNIINRAQKTDVRVISERDDQLTLEVVDSHIANSLLAGGNQVARANETAYNLRRGYRR